jgi:uncharacterized membrane protein
MVFLSVGVAFYSYRLVGVGWNIWLAVDKGIEAVGRQAPLPFLAHTLIGATALGAGGFQFIPGLRAKHPGLHRLTGRIYVAACLVAGVASLALAARASGGPIAGAGFATLGLLWIATTLGAWRAAVRRDFRRHRLLMLYSFAMTFGAVTLRLQIPFGFIFFGFHSYSDMSRWLAYTAWIPNIIVVWVYTTLESRGRRTKSAAPAGLEPT